MIKSACLYMLIKPAVDLRVRCSNFVDVCLDARLSFQYTYDEQWDMWRTFSDPLRQDPRILMELAYFMDILDRSTPQAPEYHRISSFMLIACQLQCHVTSLSDVSHVFLL